MFGGGAAPGERQESNMAAPRLGSLCGRCGREVKARVQFEGKKMGGGGVSGAQLDKMLEESFSAAYRCRSCAGLLCMGCAKTSPCPRCGAREFNSV